MEELAASLGLDLRLKFTGSLSEEEEEVTARLNVLKVFASVSTREDFGMSILETRPAAFQSPPLLSLQRLHEKKRIKARADSSLAVA